MDSSQLTMIQGEIATPYRTARSLPLELQEQCAIYLEEGLYMQALSLLSSLLVSGTSSAGTEQQAPAYVPPPAFISFLATLAVTPSTTTKTASTEKRVAADHALLYLQQLRRLVNPVTLRWSTACRFTSGANFRRSVSDRRRNAYDSDEDSGQALNVKMARQQSLWSRGEDFWHVVGWAFNCATNHQLRWQRWRLWLEHMLDVLEADLKERARMALRGSASDSYTDSPLQKSLIVQYVTGISGEVGRNEQRRIMRAIFTHGMTKDEAEFKEIWKDEAADPIKKEELHRLMSSKPSDSLALEEFSDDDLDRDETDVDMIDITVEGQESARRPRRGIRGTSPDVDTDRDVTPEFTTEHDDTAAAYGGEDAIYLRRRLLVLLSTLSAIDSSLFTNTDGILHLFSEALRPLPLPIFSALIMPTGQNALSASLTMSLCKEMFRSLLAAAAPRFDTNYIDQDDLEQRFLPAAANSVKAADHAKVSLLLEVSLWLLQDSGSLEPSSNLKKAVAAGIRARQEKAKQGRVSKSSRVETTKSYEEALMWLDASSKRLDMFLSMLEVRSPLV